MLLHGRYWKEWKEEVDLDPVEIRGESGVLGVRWKTDLAVRKVVIYNSNGHSLAVIDPQFQSDLRWSPAEHGIVDTLSFYFVMLYSQRGVLLRRALV